MSILKRFQKYVSAEIASRLQSKNEPSKASDHFTKEQAQEKVEQDKTSHVSSKEAKYYANLEVSPGASFEEIKKSYKRLLKKYHPDKFHNDKRSEYAKTIVQQLNEAYTYFEKEEQKRGSYKKL